MQCWLYALLFSSTAMNGPVVLLQVLLDSEGIDAYDQVGMQQEQGTPPCRTSWFSS